MATVIFIKESKQTPSAMRGCIRYCVQEKKTVDENGRQYVGGVNCLGQHAYEEFMATKNLYGKASGTYFYQYVQSFLPGEIQSYEEAHRIGLEFAGKRDTRFWLPRIWMHRTTAAFREYTTILLSIRSALRTAGRSTSPQTLYLRSRLEGNQSHQRIQGSAYGYEAVDHHGDCIDHRRFGDFKHGDLSSDEIRGFFMDERQESNLSDDEATETEDLTQRKYNDLREQAELGNLYAGYRLSRILFDEDSPYYDEYGGAYYLESSAKQGYHVAQYRLGKMIYAGGYYRRIPENAAYWLILSAKQKNPNAEMLLGQLYILGDFLRPDRKAGVDLLYDAIRHGNAHAAYTLGKYYADGKCLKKDIPKAIALLEQAAQMGNIHAEYRLAKIYLFESDCFDWQKAVEYLNTAAYKGNENAYRALQNMSQSTVISITTGIADLVGDLSAMFDERPAVEDCTTMPEHRERKKYEYEQSL